MSATKPPKKSDTLEVRLPHETKRAFMARCRSEGRSASEIVRGFIDAYLATSAAPEGPHTLEDPMTKPQAFDFRPTLATAGALLAAVSAVVLTATPGSAWPDLRAAFGRLDADQDGRLTLDEFLARTPPDIFVERLPPPAAASRPFMLPLEGPPATLPSADALDARPPPSPRLAEELKTMDRDSDAAVSFAEFEARHADVAREAFQTLDIDADGAIEKEEYAAATAQVPVSGEEGLRPMQIFAHLDTDRDGSVSKAEFLDAR